MSKLTRKDMSFSDQEFDGMWSLWRLKVIIQRKNSAFFETKRRRRDLLFRRNIGLYKLGESHFPQ